MNEQKESDSTAALYLHMLKRREQVDASFLDSEKVDLLVQSIDAARLIIERLALFGAAVDSGFKAVRKVVDGLQKVDPMLHTKVNRHIGGLLGLQEMYQAFYGEDAEFCAQHGDVAMFCERYTRMVAHRLLTEAGIDPNDTEAALSHLRKIGMLTQPANPLN